MLNNFFISSALYLFPVLLAMAVMLPTHSVSAQQCEAHYEMVTKLHYPEPGSYTVWNTVYGEGQKDEVFVSALNRGDDVLAVGEVRHAYGEAPTMVFAQFDYRGRKTLEKHHSISGLKEVIKILSRGDGYVVLANRRKPEGKSFGSASFWLGFFDKDLVLKSQKTIQDKKFDLFATDIVSSLGGRGWTVSATSERNIGHTKNGAIRKNASVYLLDLNGNELSSRAYILGKNNEILGLSRSKFEGKKDGYIATGYFENDIGKKIAWVLRLNDDVSMAWQKEYGRGLSAKLKVSSGYRDRYALVFGDVRPVDSGPIGSWLMLLDGNNGRTLWQRYYYGETGHHDYSAQGLYTNKDGLLTLMMTAHSTVAAVKPDGGGENEDKVEDPVFSEIVIPENMDYAHVLTLSPRGVTLSGDSYFYGQGATLSQLVEGQNGSRVMVGYAVVPSESSHKKPMSGKPETVPLKEAGHISLPDVELSDKAKEGLAMLKNKLKQKQAKHKPNDHESAHQEMKGESAKSDMDNKSAGVTRNGWIAIGDSPGTYTDPCVRKILSLD